MRKKKILHVKKLENPDFFDSKYIGKNLIMFYSLLRENPGRIYIGQVTKSSITNKLYLEGFGLIDAIGTDSELEKQTILGRDYFGRHPFYESPLTDTNHENYHFYEFEENVDIKNLRDIVDGKKKN